MELNAKNDWNSLYKKKIAGLVERDKIENVKNKIDKTANQNVADLLHQADDEKIEFQVRDEPPDRPSALEILTNKFDTRFTMETEEPKKQPLFTGDERQIEIRPEFDEMRRKVRDELSSVIMQSEKLLIPKNDEEFYDAFATKNSQMKNYRKETNFQTQQNEHFNLEESKAKNEVKQTEDAYYDFRRLNEERLTRLVKDKLNRVFPNEMENIQKIKETNYILQKNKAKTNPERENEEEMKDVPHPLFNKKGLYDEDYIEAYSIMRDPAVSKLLEDVPIYRELAPIAREIACTRNENKKRIQKACVELMNEAEFYIDELNISFQNIMHVASGRISSKRLNKILSHLDPLELTEGEDDEEEDENKSQEDDEERDEEEQAMQENFQVFSNASPISNANESRWSGVKPENNRTENSMGGVVEEGMVFMSSNNNPIGAPMGNTTNMTTTTMSHRPNIRGELRVKSSGAPEWAHQESLKSAGLPPEHDNQNQPNMLTSQTSQQSGPQSQSQPQQQQQQQQPQQNPPQPQQNTIQQQQQPTPTYTQPVQEKSPSFQRQAAILPKNTVEADNNSEGSDSGAPPAFPRMNPLGFKRSALTAFDKDFLASDISPLASNRIESKPKELNRPSADQILEEIKTIKQARKNLNASGDSSKEELRGKLEKKLVQLLFIIMEDMPMTQDINENIKSVIRDVDKLKGKVVDGHLKTRLLFQFLKEYKKLADEQLKGSESKGNNWDDEEEEGFRDNKNAIPTTESARYEGMTSSKRHRSENKKSPSPPRRPQKKPQKQQTETPTPNVLPSVREHGVRHTQSSLRKMKANLRDKLMEKAQKESKSRWIGNPIYDDDLDDEEGWVAVQ